MLVYFVSAAGCHCFELLRYQELNEKLRFQNFQKGQKQGIDFRTNRYLS